MTEHQATYSAPAAACAADVLHALKASDIPLSLAQLERSLSRSKSLIFRVLRELETRELIARDSAGRYRLGIEAFEMGAAYLNQSTYTDVIRRVLEQLARETRDTVNLGVLRGNDVLYVMKFPGASSYVTISRVGGRVPANCVAIGKALLAELSDADIRSRFSHPLPQMTEHSVQTVDDLLTEVAYARRNGYAIDREQAALGRCAMAVTAGALQPGGDDMAISISTAATDFDLHIQFLLGQLQHARSIIERDREARVALAATGKVEGPTLPMAVDPL